MTRQKAMALAGKLLGLYPNIPSDIAVAGIWAEEFVGESARVVLLAIDKCKAEEPRLNFPNFTPFLRWARGEVARLEAMENPKAQLNAENPISEEQRKANHRASMETIRKAAKKFDVNPEASRDARARRKRDPDDDEMMASARRDLDDMRERREARGLDENFQPIENQEADDAGE